MRLAFVAIVTAACVTADGDVLSVGELLTSCDQVARRSSDDQACAFADVCAVPDADDPTCCQTFVACVDGLLQFEPYCSPNCRGCMTDAECGFGVGWCEGTACVACPDPGACPPCSDGQVPLVRNGCPSCQCAPPSECDGGPGACGPVEVCYPGMVCATGCDPNQSDCCANVCAAAGCPSPAPLGCDTTCADPTCAEGCVTTACECVDTRWVCRSACGTRTGVCFQPT